MKPKTRFYATMTLMIMCLALLSESTFAKCCYSPWTGDCDSTSTKSDCEDWGGTYYADPYTCVGTICKLTTPPQEVCEDIKNATQYMTSGIFYYNKWNITKSLTSCNCKSGCGNFPDETTEVSTAVTSCSILSEGACKVEGQYYVGMRTKSGLGVKPIDCKGATCGPVDSNMTCNVTAHYVNYDDNPSYCELTECGNGVWEPSAPGSYDICPGLNGCGNAGSCCGDDAADDPDMGPTACANSSVGDNSRPSEAYPQYRRWSPYPTAVVPQNIGCCGDDMIDDCMLFGTNQNYLCAGILGQRTENIETPSPPLTGCEDPPWCYFSGATCCPQFGPTGVDPAISQFPPYNTSKVYWFWAGKDQYKGLILNITCANYQTLATPNGWVSCSDYLLNRDASFAAYRDANKEKYFKLDSGDTNPNALANPQNILDISGNHQYYCYSEDLKNYQIAECCGGNTTNDPACLSDSRLGGSQKNTGGTVIIGKLKPGTIPIYKCWGSTYSDHMLSRDRTCEHPESYVSEGVIGYMYNISGVSGTIPLYRCWNSSSPSPRHIISKQKGCGGLVDEGIIGYVYNDPVQETIPIYGCWNRVINDNIVSTDSSCEDPSYTNEETLGYVYNSLDNTTFYCSDDFSWSTDLDRKSQDSCNSAGFVATGKYCCSENDDAEEYYNDPGGIGCWNKTPQSNGNYAVGDRQYPEIFVYNGSFYGCAIDNNNPNFNPTGDPNKPYEGSINLLVNPDFADGLTSYQSYGADANIFREGSLHFKTLQITYNAPGDYVSQKGIILKNGDSYTITFEAKSDYAVTIPSYYILKVNGGSGIIRCGPFNIEEDWKLFRCSGTWASDQPAELVLETTGDASNRIFYDNIRVFSKNDFLLNIEDQPNPGGGGPVKGALIKDMSYCQGFDTDHDGTNDYFCSYLEQWKASPNRTKLSYIAWTPADPNTQKAECCQVDSCWAGQEPCIPNQAEISDPEQAPAYPIGSENGFRCMNGEWKYSILKYTWSGDLSGYCQSDSQCLVQPYGNADNNGKPETYSSYTPMQCINNSQYILDHYCENGKWTSRTRLLATDLSGLAANMGLTSYTLFCEDYTETLNIFSKALQSYDFTINPFGPFINYFNAEQCKSKQGEGVNCVNKICILKYYQGSTERAIFGTTINVPINSTTLQPVEDNPYILSVFGKYQDEVPTYCQNAINPDGNYHMCKGNDIWYNHKTQALIYNKDGITSFLMTSNPFIKFFKSLFGFIQFWKPKNPLYPEKGIDMSFINKSADFNRLYIDVKLTTSIRAVRESVYDTNLRPPATVDFIAINYTGFNANICDTVAQLNEIAGSYYEAIVCNQTGTSYYVTTRDIDYFDLRNYDIWARLTSELRVK